MENWLHYVAGDFERHRLNPPTRTLIKGQDGKRYEELLDAPDWIALGYVPRPKTQIGWFAHHIIHGLAMRYPLRAVVAFALLNSPPPVDKRSSEMQTETMKHNRIDLWLNRADLLTLDHFANHYKTSCQRIIEAALAQAAARGLTDDGELSRYERAERIPIRLDQLGREQLDRLTTNLGISQQDALRLALRSLFAQMTDHSPHN